MAKRKTKVTDIAAEEAALPDSAVAEGNSESPPIESRGHQAEGPAETQAESGEVQKKWVDPVGRHRINLGDGRHLALSRSNRWQQMQIRFVPDRDEVDPRPSKEDTEVMKEHGFRWRAEDKAWTKQLDKNTEENWAARGNSDLAAHELFVELANRIRQRNGLEPVSGISSEGRGA